MPSVGRVNKLTKVCMNLTELKSETVFLNLKVGVTYSFDIFHVERYPCKSQFFFYTSGAALRPKSEVIDYLAFPKEDDQVNSIIADVLVSDEFDETGCLFFLIFFFILCLVK